MFKILESFAQFYQNETSNGDIIRKISTGSRSKSAPDVLAAAIEDLSEFIPKKPPRPPPKRKITKSNPGLNHNNNQHSNRFMEISSEFSEDIEISNGCRKCSNQGGDTEYLDRYIHYNKLMFTFLI